MNNAARSEYVMTEVMTAAPQKLQLMLIEGALRFAERARRHWDAAEEEQAAESLLRCQDIVAGLIGGLNLDVRTPIVQRLVAIYVFVYRSLIQALLEHDTAKLSDAQSVLEVERETWREVCDKLGATRPADPAAEPPNEGFSFEA